MTIGRPAPPRPPSTRGRRRTTSRSTSSDPPAPGPSLCHPEPEQHDPAGRDGDDGDGSTPPRRDCDRWATSSTCGRTAPSAFLRSEIRSYAGRGPGRMVPGSRSVARAMSRTCPVIVCRSGSGHRADACGTPGPARSAVADRPLQVAGQPETTTQPTQNGHSHATQIHPHPRPRSAHRAGVAADGPCLRRQ